MSMRITAGWIGGQGFGDWARTVRDAGSIAVQAGVSTASTELRDEIRNQISEAGLGEKLGNAVGLKLYPPGQKGSFGAAGYIFPRGRKATAIFDSFNSASVITAHKGKYLAVPTPAAGRGYRNAKPTPEEFQQRTGIKLSFVRFRSGSAGLVGHSRKAGKARGGNTVYFILILQARMPRRLSFDAIARKWADRIPDLIEAASKGGDA